MIRFKTIGKVLGLLLITYGAMMSLPLLASMALLDASVSSIFLSAIFTSLSGAILFLFCRKNSQSVGKREGYLVVVLGWVMMTVFGMLPYLLSGTIPSLTDAFFETISGLTTTGASILPNIEAVDQGILLWRSMTQWIGGMGIIVLTVALLPLLGIGGVELFVAEVPGPTNDKIHPKIRDTARILWLVYVFLTAILTLILWLEGMTFLDAMNHGFTTMATGGFSTKNASIAFYSSPLIQYTLIFFMILAGTNYTLLYFGLSGKVKKMWKSDEFKTYLFSILGLAVVIGLLLYTSGEYPFELAFRNGLFQLVSIITTTGFVSADYTSWSTSFTLFFLILMFVGGCAGSTSGGIKFVRHIVFIKNSWLEFKRLLHPHGLIRMKIDRQIVAPRVLTHILVFLLIYLLLFLVGSVVVAFLGMDILSAIGAVATSLSNVGPGIGEVGPMNNFAGVPTAAKWVLAFLMLAGRLELFTVLILFTPYFWRSN